MVRSRSEAEAAWRDRLKQFEESGLSVAEFCRQEGVSDASFYTWRKRLNSSRPARPATGQRKRGGVVKADTFIPVNVTSASVVELEFPNGVRIRVPSCDTESLRIAILTGSEVFREGS